MSDIKQIVPEKDWTKYVIKDEPVPPTPTNIVTENFLNGMSGVVKKNDKTAINRIVPNSNGWTVIEYSDRWVEMTRVMYAETINFKASGNLFATNLANSEVISGMNFPYPFTSIKGIEISALQQEGSAAVLDIWSSNVDYSLSRINLIRLMSSSSGSRNIRFSVTVKGFR